MAYVILVILLLIATAAAIGSFKHFKKIADDAIENSKHLSQYQGIVDIENEISTRGQHLEIIDNANQASDKLNEINNNIWGSKPNGTKTYAKPFYNQFLSVPTSSRLHSINPFLKSA